jgi:hypothetical protein
VAISIACLASIRADPEFLLRLGLSPEVDLISVFLNPLPPETVGASGACVSSSRLAINLNDFSRRPHPEQCQTTSLTGPGWFPVNHRS